MKILLYLLLLAVSGCTNIIPWEYSDICKKNEYVNAIVVIENRYILCNYGFKLKYFDSVTKKTIWSKENHCKGISVDSVNNMVLIWNVRGVELYNLRNGIFIKRLSNNSCFEARLLGKGYVAIVEMENNTTVVNLINVETGNKQKLYQLKGGFVKPIISNKKYLVVVQKKEKNNGEIVCFNFEERKKLWSQNIKMQDYTVFNDINITSTNVFYISAEKKDQYYFCGLNIETGMKSTYLRLAENVLSRMLIDNNDNIVIRSNSSGYIYNTRINKLDHLDGLNYFIISYTDEKLFYEFNQSLYFYDLKNHSANYVSKKKWKGQLTTVFPVDRYLFLISNKENLFDNNKHIYFILIPKK